MNEARRTALVTGATGFIGEALVRKLLARGDAVRVLVRNRQKLERLGLGIDDVVEGDITNREAVMRATDGVDVVYAIAGTFREAQLADRDYRAINVEAVGTLLEAAIANGVSRVVHCSTCGIHGSIDEGRPADESHAIRPVGIYEETKAAGEQLAFELGRADGVEVTAIRPTPVYGPGDTRLLKLFKLARRKPTILIGDGTAAYHLVYIDDLTEAFVLAGSRPGVAGQAFLIGGPEIPSLNDILQTLAALDGREKLDVVRVPAKPVWLAGWLCEAVCRPLGVSPPIYRRRVEFFINNRAYKIDKARELLGYEPKVGIRDGLQRTAEWYREQRLL